MFPGGRRNEALPIHVNLVIHEDRAMRGGSVVGDGGGTALGESRHAHPLGSREAEEMQPYAYT